MYETSPFIDEDVPFSSACGFWTLLSTSVAQDVRCVEKGQNGVQSRDRVRSVSDWTKNGIVQKAGTWTASPEYALMSLEAERTRLHVMIALC